MTRILLAILGLMTLVAYFQAGAEEAPVGFDKLHDALVFIDTALDHNDWATLGRSLYPPFQKGQPNRDDWEFLRKARGNQRLAEIYRSTEFPANGSKFSIGGCMAAPIPHAHIDFLADGNSWRITAFWECR